MPSGKCTNKWTWGRTKSSMGKSRKGFESKSIYTYPCRKQVIVQNQNLQKLWWKVNASWDPSMLASTFLYKSAGKLQEIDMNLAENDEEIAISYGLQSKSKYKSYFDIWSKCLLHVTLGGQTFLTTAILVIGRVGTVAWLETSPDLTPLDFLIWGFVKKCLLSSGKSSISNEGKDWTSDCNCKYWILRKSVEKYIFQIRSY